MRVITQVGQTGMIKLNSKIQYFILVRLVKVDSLCQEMKNDDTGLT